jgi:HSP20 family molecular chaperone IbpA
VTAPLSRLFSTVSFGSMKRSERLPAGAEETKIIARYDKGVFTVTVPIAEPRPTERTNHIRS